jgi:hypothetical protein
MKGIRNDYENYEKYKKFRLMDNFLMWSAKENTGAEYGA